MTAGNNNSGVLSLEIAGFEDLCTWYTVTPSAAAVSVNLSLCILYTVISSGLPARPKGIISTAVGSPASAITVRQQLAVSLICSRA